MKIVKIALIFILVGCLFNMPYGYYQFVRLAAIIGFGLLSYDAIKHQQRIIATIYVALILLFQPFIKIVIHRPEWQIIDILVAVFLIISLFIKPNQHGKIR